MFILHVHGLGDYPAEEYARELLTETTLARNPEELPMATQPLTSASQLQLAILQSNPDGTKYEHVGILQRKSSPEKTHQLFSTNHRVCHKFTDLGQMIATAEFRDTLGPIQRIQLSTLIAITHLYFANIRVSCTKVRPSDFSFYNTTPEPMLWDDDEPFILNPYLSVGFGNRKPPRNLGGSSGRTQQKNNTVAELGLLLHQIGSSSKIEYGNGAEGFRKAKEQALHSIHNLDSHRTLN
jgi:hypothetical protein